MSLSLFDRVVPSPDAIVTVIGTVGTGIAVQAPARCSSGHFRVDRSSGEAVVGAPDVVEGADLVDFAGIPHRRFPTYPLAQQLAEKLHAYTLPRVAPNTRTKDYVDLVVIPTVERYGAPRQRAGHL